MRRGALFVAAVLLMPACTFDPTDWTVDELEPTWRDPDVTGVNPAWPRALPENPSLGVGLTLHLGVSLQQHKSHLFTAPRNFRAVPDDASAIDVRIGRTITVHDEDENREETELFLTAKKEGSGRVRLLCDDTNEVQALTYVAKASPQFDSFVIWDGERPVPSAPELSAFTSTSLLVRARYLAGGSAVLGTEAFSATGSGETNLDAGVITFANAPHDEVVRLGAQSLTFHVVNGSGVNDLAATLPEAIGQNGLDGGVGVVKAGLNFELRYDQLDGQGATIFGHPEAPVSFAVTSDAVTSGNDGGVDTTGDLFFHAAHPGSAEIQLVSQSGKPRTVTIQVTP